MKVRVSLVIQSHLSDVMIEMSWNTNLAQERLRFVKYLVSMFPNTDTEIDVEEVYKQFQLGDN